MKRRVFVSIALLAMIVPTVAFLASCKATPKVQVGIVLPTKDEPSWIQDQTRFQDALKAAGYTSEILFSQGDSAKESANVDSLLTKGVKVIIICPQDASAAAAAADKAHAAGVKVISYDRLIRDSASVDYYVTFDSVAVGAAWGTYLVRERQGKGQQPVPVRRRRLRQQRVPLLPGRLERSPAQDR